MYLFHKIHCLMTVISRQVCSSCAIFITRTVSLTIIYLGRVSDGVTFRLLQGKIDMIKSEH